MSTSLILELKQYTTSNTEKQTFTTDEFLVAFINVLKWKAFAHLLHTTNERLYCIVICIVA